MAAPGPRFQAGPARQMAESDPGLQAPVLGGCALQEAGYKQISARAPEASSLPGCDECVGGEGTQLGAIGLVIPALTGILPILTPIAAGGLLLTMVGAAATHVRRREYGSLVPTAILAAMALAVIVLRV